MVQVFFDGHINRISLVRWYVYVRIGCPDAITSSRICRMAPGPVWTLKVVDPDTITCTGRECGTVDEARPRLEAFVSLSVDPHETRQLVGNDVGDCDTRLDWTLD